MTRWIEIGFGSMNSHQTGKFVGENVYATNENQQLE